MSDLRSAVRELLAQQTKCKEAFETALNGINAALDAAGVEEVTSSPDDQGFVRTFLRFRDGSFGGGVSRKIILPEVGDRCFALEQASRTLRMTSRLSASSVVRNSSIIVLPLPST